MGPLLSIRVPPIESISLSGKHNLVISEVESRSAPEFRALTLLAKIMQNPSNKEALVSEVQYLGLSFKFGQIFIIQMYLYP